MIELIIFVTIWLLVAGSIYFMVTSFPEFTITRLRCFVILFWPIPAILFIGVLLVLGLIPSLLFVVRCFGGVIKL